MQRRDLKKNLRERENLDKLSIDEWIVSIRMMSWKRDLRACFSFIALKLLAASREQRKAAQNLSEWAVEHWADCKQTSYIYITMTSRCIILSEVSSGSIEFLKIRAWPVKF